MRRAAGVAVVVAGAVLGAGSGVLANDRTHPSDRRDVAAVTGGSLPADGASYGTSAPPSPAGASPGASPTTGRTGGPSAVPTAAVTAAQLLTVADLGRAGWDTAALTARTQVGEGAVPTGVCQQQSLLANPGAGTRVRVDLTGRWTSAHEVAATFASAQRATSAYDVLRAGLTSCRAGTWSPGGVRLTVGPEVAVALPEAGATSDRGVWSTVAPQTGATGATGAAGATSTAGTPRPGVMGVLLVGRRVAVVQVDDPAPRASTVGAIMAAAASRLAR